MIDRGSAGSAPAWAKTAPCQLRDGAPGLVLASETITVSNDNVKVLLAFIPNPFLDL
jgi:hypothetical protein